MANNKSPIFTRTFAVFLASILSMLFSQPALSLTVDAGKRIELSGEFSVSGGQASYSLPISVAPGRAGHQPSLSLEYRSDSPNGMLGMGWSLGGMSSIARCGKNLEKDGRWGGVNFNADDRFCLDGQRLVAISGRDGENLTEYRVENNGYAKIVSFGRAGNGPVSFKIWYKDGSVYEYGVTEDSRVELPSQAHVYKWALNKITDASKANHINFVYSENNSAGQHKLAQIDYIGGKVNFVYENRPDSTSQYLGGKLLNRAERLKLVETFGSNGDKIGTYGLTYQQSANTSRSQLYKVAYCAGGQCSTDIEFSWTGRKHVSLRSAQNTGLTAPRFMETNGSGFARSYGVVTKNSNGTMSVKDLNNIVHPNINSFSLSGNVISPSVVFNKCPLNTASSYNKGNGQFGYYCQFNTCSGSSCKHGSSGTNYGDFDGDGKEESQSGYLVIDINGDGIDDRHKFDVAGGSYHYQISGADRKTLPLASGRVLKAFTDINNDGYLDAVMGSPSSKGLLYVHLFNGKTFNSPIAISHHKVSHEESVHFADLNNDGYPELGFGQYFYLNTKNNQFSRSALIDAGAKIYSTQDINGDGWTDVVTRADGNNVKAQVKYSNSAAQDKITTFSEVGIEYKVTYQAASNSTSYSTHVSTPGLVTAVPYTKLTQGSTSYPYKVVTPRRYLVSNVTKAPKGYKATDYSYKYEGAKTHLKGGGFLGFKTITETETADVVTVTRTTFEQDRLAVAGKPLSIVVTKNGKKVSESAYHYKQHTRQGYGAKYYQVYADKVVKRKYGLNRDAIEREETITRVLDRFGNLLDETSVISSELEGAGQFTSRSQFDYLSTGVNNNHHIYDITSVSNIDNLAGLLSTFKAGLGRYCASNGDIYFKPNDHIVLIHSDVDIPLVLQRYNAYFKYQVTGSSTDLDGLTVYTGKLVNASAADFTAANPQSCGSYAIGDFDGDGKMEFTTSKTTRTELVTETGDNFWKIGAVATSTSTLTDNATNLERTISNTYNYDSQGFLTSSTVNSSDYESTSDIASGGKSVTNRYSYDQWGNVVSQSVEGTDLAARTSTTLYDSQGLYVTSSANALGHRSSTQFNAQGLLTKSVSALKGRTSSFAYDTFGRVTSETLPGTGNTNLTQYKLGAQCGSHSTSQTVSCVTTKPASGGQVTTLFDYAGREVRKLHTGFSGQLVVVDTRWDRNGRKLSVTRPQFVGTKATAPVVTFAYDALNREIKKQEPANDGGIASFVTTYDGYKTSVKDARGFNHSTVTNVMGHILRKDEPHDAYQTYQYYPDGKLKASTDSAGNTTEIRYDNLGHRSYLDDPDMGKWSYTYNAAGELTYKRDAKGTVTTIEYDRLGRKTKQVEGGKVSTWRYDERGAFGTLSGFAGNGSETDYYYNDAGLTEEVAVKVNGEKFSSYYFYDKFERVAREVRPNGVDTTLAGAAKLLSQSTSADRLALEYVYNPHGYVAAVRSPKSYADEAFTSASFREDIKQLLDQAIAQAAEYLTKAERYATQESFFTDKAAEYNSKTVNVHNLDASSQALLGKGYRYKQWCNDQGECYLRPATWVLLHDDVTIPLDITLEGAIYRLSTSLANRSSAGVRNYNATVHPVSAAEFASRALTPSHDFILTDYDSNGQKDLMSNKDIYIAQADSATTTELLFAADDLSQAATIASTRYKFYTDLANQLINLSEKVAELSGLYCEYANQLGGGQLQANQRTNCANTQQSSQAEHLNLILTQSQLEDSLDNPAYVYYWQRRETDAYDHTLSETLGNGLVNTYNHDANTGRPSYITTHKANVLFDPRISGSTTNGLNIRFIQYRYDNHNNVTYRYDEQLGITDRWEYDGIDRVISNGISLASKTQHGDNNPDLAGPFVYRYDKLGNLMFKTGIGDYVYNNQQAGPHAVTKANGLNYQYDANGNMLRAWANGSQHNERELEWTEFNKPNKITRNGKTVEFFYDANHNRYLKKNSDGIETFYFGKSYERVTDTNTGVVQHKHFIYADGKLIALNTHTDDGENKLKDKQTRYLHYDALNSVDMITDGYGVVVERRSYDTWGKQRKVAWREEGPLDVVQQAITNRGYTGHEEIVEVGLVHMNGRVYDQELGRFISPDPFVQAPYITNSFNRYAYVMNNPLKYTDPTGYLWDSVKSAARSVGRAISRAARAVRDFFRGGGNKGSGRNGNSDSKSPKKNLEGEGFGFTAGYIGRAVGWLFDGEGNTEADQKKMAAKTAEAQCRRGRCGMRQMKAIGAAIEDSSVSISNSTWERWDNMTTTPGHSFQTSAIWLPVLGGIVGGGLELYNQYQRDDFNLPQVGISALSGALGGWLGVRTAGFHAMKMIALNGIGSAAIGAGAAYLRNLNDNGDRVLVDEAARSGALGLLGSSVGVTVSRGGKLLSSSQKRLKMNTIKDANLVNQISGHGNPTSIEAAANAIGDVSGAVISNQ
ncbi:RHS repeat-associated core domain-containing protein [Vibrio aestuarianus]|uniref:RHS repeat-associated core domain-containing protein n=1 Tax=Vibrio aestuarianus TaxID=28171 RepID=UPI00237C6314|nr:RHS repeat-associated core domain-containing protein [Vibrio aestuarianus]MDE1310019.1 FG-GAP-like repeat-containing protein [Vibrio aestuarianus]